MKTTKRTTPAQPMLPAPAQQRQLSIAFETPALQGLAADQQASSIRTLALMLLQAAGIHLREDDDVEY